MKRKKILYARDHKGNSYDPELVRRLTIRSEEHKNGCRVLNVISPEAQYNLRTGKPRSNTTVYFSYQGKTITLTRAAWIGYVGPIPEGAEVRHTPECESKRCCAKNHLMLITEEDTDSPDEEIVLPVATDAKQFDKIYAKQLLNMSRQGLIKFVWEHAIKGQIDALEAADKLFREVLPKFKWDSAFLDADAIRQLNETPSLVAKALADTEEKK